MRVRNVDMEIRIYELDYIAPQRDFIVYSTAVKYKWSHNVFKVSLNFVLLFFPVTNVILCYFCCIVLRIQRAILVIAIISGGL